MQRKENHMNKELFAYFEAALFEKCDGWGEYPSTVWRVNKEDNGDNYPATFTLLSTGENPYELMDDFVEIGMSGASILSLRGWAAPITDDEESVPPSLHEDRIRVILHIYLDGSTEKPVVCMHRQGVELEVMDEDGTGALRDAIETAINNHKKVSK
jgi:hypothetical protein